MSVRRVAVVVAGAALALTAPATAVGVAGAGAAPVHASAKASSARIVPTGGVTMLKLNGGTAAALTKAGVQVRLASEARTSPSGIEFPIRGGLLRARTLAGTITHSGGLTFVAGGKRLTIRDFTVNTRTKRLTAYADQARARLPILDLDLSKATITARSHTLGVTGVRATLDGAAAKALNSYFHTTLFSKGLPIGTVRISAKTVVLH